MSKLYEGFRGFLVPTLMTAPGAAYSMPEITVRAIAGERITVELPNGSMIETDAANVRRGRPEPRAPRQQPAPARIELPAGYIEETLF
jgi:hypothetical protein